MSVCRGPSQPPVRRHSNSYPFQAGDPLSPLSHSASRSERRSGTREATPPSRQQRRGGGAGEGGGPRVPTREGLAMLMVHADNASLWQTVLSTQVVQENVVYLCAFANLTDTYITPLLKQTKKIATQLDICAPVFDEETCRKIKNRIKTLLFYAGGMFSIYLTYLPDGFFRPKFHSFTASNIIEHSSSFAFTLKAFGSDQESTTTVQKQCPKYYTCGAIHVSCNVDIVFWFNFSLLHSKSVDCPVFRTLWGHPSTWPEFGTGSRYF